MSFNVSHRSFVRGRSLAAPLIVAGTLALPSAALASPRASVRTHIHRAEHALKLIRNAADDGTVSIPLGVLNANLSAAASVSAHFAVTADTQGAMKVAGSLLGQVAAAEAQIEATLTSDASQISASGQLALTNAAIQIADDRQATISVLGNLEVDAQTSAQADVSSLAQELASLSSVDATLASDLQTLVGNVDGSITTTSACSVAGAVAQLASTETTDVQSDISVVNGLVSVLGSAASVDLSQLGSVSSELTGSISTQAQAGASCDAPTEGSSSTSASGSVSGSVSGSGSLSLTGLLGL